jgi:hypothetical protein
MAALGRKRISQPVRPMSASPPKAELLEFEPLALRRKGRVGLQEEFDCNSSGKAGIGYGRHWRELVCSVTPSARPFQNLFSGRSLRRLKARGGR